MTPTPVEAAVAHYHRLLEADPSAAREQLEWFQDAFRRQGVTFDGAAMPSFLRPQLVGRADWDRLRAQGRRLLELAARVARHAFEGDVGRLCAFLGTPAAEARWLALDPGPPDVVLSRLDAFLTPQGPRFIEVNSDAPAGFGYGDRMARVYRDLPVFREFARRRAVSYQASDEGLVRAVAGARSGMAAGVGGIPLVALVDWAEVKTRADQEILREAFLARGFDCVLADPRAMAVREGRLWTPERPVDVVYRRAVLSELVAHEAEAQAFLAAYRDRLCPFINSLRCRLSEDKAFFAVLTDEAFGHLMSGDERAFVARALPWTRKVEERRTIRDGREVDLVPHVLEHRDRLVLKPAHDYGGRSVFVGDETPAAEWEAAMRAALGSPWVVQERVTIPEEPFPAFEGGSLTFVPLKVNTNPFYVAGHEAGAVTRASRSSVINVSAGGGSVPTFVIE
ncbi:MAG TPA: circularly permuted type 2 ATP-grasp protein [Vicinamibacteria bacterium]|nr:circularly permuted type 2 ATP-grasp protein [Vicinamibacteria bacterium]